MQGLNGPVKMQEAIDLLQKLPQDLIVTPAQTLGELFKCSCKKPGVPLPKRVRLS